MVKAAMVNGVKHCPLCGAVSRVQESVYHRYVRIFCVECGLSTMDCKAELIDDLIQHWNNRVDEPEVE
jgi:transcription elongation factor Elf1